MKGINCRTKSRLSTSMRRTRTSENSAEDRPRASIDRLTRQSILAYVFALDANDMGGQCLEAGQILSDGRDCGRLCGGVLDTGTLGEGKESRIHPATSLDWPRKFPIFRWLPPLSSAGLGCGLLFGLNILTCALIKVSCQVGPGPVFSMQ